MAMTFSTMKTGLDAISGRIQSNSQKLERAAQLIDQAEADLGLLATQYAATVAAIRAAADGSDDPALLTAKAEADLLTAEFNALKATATAQKNALAAL